MVAGSHASLENIVAMDDGRVIAVGAKGVVLISTDDGQSFTRHAHPFTRDWIFGLHAWQGLTFLGGDGLILQFS